MIPAEKSAAFVCQMEAVLSVYERAYDAAFPVVCMDESPKQVLDYKGFVGSDGKHYQDSEYVRKGVVELFVATEPLAGRRVLSVEQDHKSATWVKFIARQMDTVYKDAVKVTWVMDNFSTHKPAFSMIIFRPGKPGLTLSAWKSSTPLPTAVGSTWPKSSSPSSPGRNSTGLSAALKKSPKWRASGPAGKTGNKRR